MTWLRSYFLLPVLLITLVSAAQADVRLPALFGDNMLLQAGPSTRVWGWAAPGEKVTVLLQGKSTSATADAAGNWEVRVAAEASAAPIELTVAGATNTITVRNVLVGEAWVVAGQSNVWWPVSRTVNAEQEIAAAKHPKIRLFAVPVRVETEPAKDITLDHAPTVPEMPQPAVSGRWVECSPEVIGDFSGLAYYFGRDLHRDLGVPIGVIAAGVGGTIVEAWTSEQALLSTPGCSWVVDHWKNYKSNEYPKKLAAYQAEHAKWKAAVERAKAPEPEPPIDADRYVNRSGALYNGMVAPLTRCSIKGVAWYQGESNANKPETYALSLKTMIQDWRSAWDQGDFPFLIVQMPNVDASKYPSLGKDWPALREAQAEAAAAMPNTGIVVTIDIGKADDLHPPDKQSVSRRLATMALAMAYGEDVVASGPVFDSMTVDGSSLRLAFKQADGLAASDGGAVIGFEVAGPDGVFVPAEARIDESHVVVSSPKVNRPTAARYAWKDNPQCNLVNAAGLPAAPFQARASLQATGNGNTFSLVEAGQPLATIVLAKEPTVAAAYAAKEFRDHVEKITGAKLAIAHDVTTVDGPKILIGDSLATANLGLRGSNLQFQEHLIQFKDDALVLLGRDKNVFHPVATAADLDAVALPGWFDERATLNAVYDLLEQYCGIRWYHPTDVGMVCPSTKTLSIERRDLRRKQDMISIRGYFHATYYMPEYRNQMPQNEVDVWRLRMRMGGHPLQMDHSFYDYYDRFLKTHPDWFAKGYEEYPLPPQLCYTNPELIQQVAQDARDYFDGKYLFDRFPLSALPAGSDYFPLVPMDDMRWCQCDRCQAQFDVPYKNVSTSHVFSSGEASNYIWGFVNNVAKEIAKTHPGKYVGCVAYQQFAYYPTKVKLEPNVAVQFCLWNLRGWHIPKLKAVETRIIEDWTKRGEKRPMSIWAYYMNPPGVSIENFEPFPYYFGREAIRQMKFFKEIGISGMWMAHTSEIGLPHQWDLPDHYLAVRLAENSQLDGERMLDEYFTLYYGAAAEPMRQLYDALEQVYTDPKNYPAEWLREPNVRITEEIAWGKLGTPDRMKQWQSLIDQAVAAAQTPMEKTRVAYFVRGVWKTMVKGARDHEALKAKRRHDFHARVPKSPTSFGGDPTKVDWSAARDIGPFSTRAGIPMGDSPHIVSRPMTVKLIHDGSYLYVQYTDPLDPALLDSGTPFGAQTFTDPLFFDSFVFQVAPKNQQVLRSAQVFGPREGWTQIVGSGNADESWKSGWRAISDKSRPDQWQALVAVSLSELVPGGVRAGMQVRGNFYRYCLVPRGGMLVWRPHFNMDLARDIKYMGKITLE